MDKSVTYRYQDSQLIVTPTFMYEVDLYYVSNNRANLLLSRVYTSDRELNVNEVEVVKRFKKFSIERFITLIGAPIAFIKENNLQIYEPNKPKKKTIKKKKL